MTAMERLFSDRFIQTPNTLNKSEDAKPFQNECAYRSEAAHQYGSFLSSGFSRKGALRWRAFHSAKTAA